MVNKEKIEKEMRTLEKHIKYHNYRYYTLNDPEILDSEYDELLYRLHDLEKEYPYLKSKNSPTNQVGASVLKNTLDKVKHTTKMLSLDKARNVDELREWLEKKVKKHGKIEIGLYYKADGLSLSLVYNDNGYLSLAKTRGNGRVGEDVTHSALQIPNIKNRSGVKEDKGEVVLLKEYLEKINQEAKKKNEEKIARNLEPSETVYENCRNAASGILRNKEVSSYIKYLKFLPHNRGDLYIKKVLLTQENIEEIILECQKAEEKRSALDFDIDGVVVKMEDELLRKHLGATAHHPRWAIAFKFEAEKAKSPVIGITEQVGRTGKLTPVAEIEPIRLMGSTISRVTLHNYDFIRQHKIKIGDELLIEKAGDVIPKVVKNLTKHDSYVLEYPQICPECGGLADFDEKKVFLYCTNQNCSSRTIKKFEYFIQSMDIKGIGIKTLKQMLDRFELQMPYDLYNISINDMIMVLDNTKEKSAKKMYKEIQKSKDADLWRVITALGIDGVGSELGRDLADNFKSLEKLRKATYNDLKKLDGVGDKIARNIEEYFQSKYGINMVSNLIKHNIGVYQRKDGGLNKRFAITGSFSLSRKEIEKLIINNGGEVKGFSGKTDVLLAGKKAGSKLQKAKEQGIEVWEVSEVEDFIIKLKTT
ncbi:MAG: NAD-dependent DNA ligase LigA [bacterium]